MKAIRFFRSVPRWLLVRSLGGTFPGLATGPFSCLEWAEVEPPPLPAPDWVRVRPSLSGICGSDLSAIACTGSPYFAPFVSTPFVLGHEVVGEITATGPGTPPVWKVGARVVLEPALGCAVRGLTPPCGPCAAGRYAHCLNILKGTLAGGIQTGYCASTGGGWSSSLVAHPSQLHAVPPGLSDEEAVLAEPFACALHGVVSALQDSKAESLLVIGCGSIGLLTIAAYRALGGAARVLAVARYRHQEEAARKLGASEVLCTRDAEALYAWILERCGGSLHRPELGKPVALGGVPVVFDCVGSAESIDESLRLAAPCGQVVLVGMPGIPKGIDWTAVWYKALRIQGAYAYGWEEIGKDLRAGERVTETPAARNSGELPAPTLSSRRIKTIDLALELMASGKAGPVKELVNRKHPLESYRLALDEAFHAGRSGAFKVVFAIGK